jgi:hypothetical protein
MIPQESGSFLMNLLCSKKNRSARRCLSEDREEVSHDPRVLSVVARRERRSRRRRNLSSTTPMLSTWSQRRRATRPINIPVANRVCIHCKLIFQI